MNSAQLPLGRGHVLDQPAEAQLAGRRALRGLLVGQALHGVAQEVAVLGQRLQQVGALGGDRGRGRSWSSGSLLRRASIGSRTTLGTSAVPLPDRNGGESGSWPTPAPAPCACCRCCRPSATGPAPTLAERLGVSLRTLRRDVDRLRELGYPVEAHRGVDGGYQLAAGAALPPLVVDDEEAVALAVGLQAAAQAPVAGIEEASVRALAKVVQVMPPRLRRRVDALRAVTVPAVVERGRHRPSTPTC